MAPIVRDQVRDDLRLERQAHGADSVQSSYPRARFTSYLPQAMVVKWSNDGSAVVTGETHLGGNGTLAMGKLWKRRASNELAFLPNALAIEGFMVRHFKGPDIAWLDYHREVRRGSLGFRTERGVPGWYIKGLQEALTLFEFAPNQVGTALFVDEELAGCFVTPHPEDYAALHDCLLTDSYAEYLIHYGYLRYARTNELKLDLAMIEDLQTLTRAFHLARVARGEEERDRMAMLEGRELDSQTVYTTGIFTLERFVTRLTEGDNFAGEAILREDGTLEYLKLFRLSRGQNRRLHLLSTLAANGWDFARAAGILGVFDANGVARSLAEAELEYLLNREIYRNVLRQVTPR